MRIHRYVPAFVTAVLLSSVGLADGRTITVHTLADNGPDSLRGALAAAANGDTINIITNGTILLTSGELVVSKSVTIHGPGPKGIVNGNGASRVFHIMPGTSVALNGFTITNGRTSLDLPFPDDAGGGIFADHANLTLDNCVVSNNTARLGGAICSSTKDGGGARLTVSNSTLSNNSARSSRGFDGGFGGGIFCGGGFFGTGLAGPVGVTLNKSRLSGNSAESFGGAIFNDGTAGSATLAITNSTLSGNSAFAVFNGSGAGGAVYNNGDSGVATVTLKNSSLTDNSANFGGGIYNDANSSITAGHADVTITNSALNQNSAEVGGGAVNSYTNLGSVTIMVSNTIVAANSANDGGGIFSDNDYGNATLTMDSCELRNNFAREAGGAALVKHILCNATNTTISGNSAAAEGGGLSIDSVLILGQPGLSRVHLTKCNLTGNKVFDRGVGGGISNIGRELTLLDCTVANNSAELSGGGIFNENTDYNIALKLQNSTISGNSAGVQGGGIFNAAFFSSFSGSDSATVILIDSTVSGNAAVFGGGIFNFSAGLDNGHNGIATIVVKNSTLSQNSAGSGGGIFNWGSKDLLGISTVAITNSVVNGGTSGENLVAFQDGIFTSHGYNLSSDAAGGDNTIGPGGLLKGPGDIRNTNPLLGPLQNNGGLTMTHALLDRSPAINAGDPNFSPASFNPPLLYDQRDGPPFPRVKGGRIDIGAIEAR
jgi:predicted outer membrane repeat protein